MPQYDCVVCGEICVDLVARNVPRDRPLADLGMLTLGSLTALTGGIVPNSGIALARLGLATASLGVIGDDEWGQLIRRRLDIENVDSQHLVVRTDRSTSATLILVSDDSEHTFAFCPGASQTIDRTTCLQRLDLFRASRYALFGYYNLLPNLEHDLPEVLAAVQSTGCKTALDTTNGGGTFQPLDRILPHLDIYVPSYTEARSQTSESEPVAMLRRFRTCATDSTLLGVKLGERGALLSPAPDSFIEIPPVSPPGPIVDTTGAGDCFYSGLIAGLARGLSVYDAGRLAAAAGAAAVTAVGGATGVGSFDAMRRLATT